MENFWSVVYFTDENSVEVVPNIWFDKKQETCAWPAKPKYVKKCIESQQKPNKTDFTYHPARKLGKKSYTSLAEARAKLPKATRMSDLSSTDDDVKKRKKKSLSISPDMFQTVSKLKKGHLASTCPQPKHFCDFNKEDCVATTSSLVDKKSIFDDISYSNSSNAYDSDSNPLWELNKNTGNDHNDNTSINPATPSSKKSTAEHSKVLCSPSANWTVDNIHENTIIYENDENCDALRVKRVLFHENNKPKISKILQNESNTSTQNNFNIESFNSHADYEKYIFTTVTHMKYDINNMMNVINVMHTNIESLMDSLTGKSVANCAVSRDNHQDVDLHSIFPINTDEQLTSIESKIIQDIQFRNILVSKLSLIAVASDLGHSLRRIVARMFDDEFLVNYSLIGFKKKKPFTKLMLYRVIIDSLRRHTKYKMATDREIELPLGVWLAHAPFRLSKKLK